MTGRRKVRAFTLIELLIVVAIIAILAMIAVPNFLEAQARAKVATEKADLRTITVALEAYCVDYTQYPPWRTLTGGATYPNSYRFRYLTTPIAYMTSVPKDPFSKYKETDSGDGKLHWDTYDFVSWNGKLDDDPHTWSHWWRCSGFGPDWVNQFAGGRSDPRWDINIMAIFPNMIYDPTNGTVSWGDIVRVGPRSPTTTRGYAPIETLPQ